MAPLLGNFGKGIKYCSRTLSVKKGGVMAVTPFSPKMLSVKVGTSCQIPFSLLQFQLHQNPMRLKWHWKLNLRRWIVWSMDQLIEDPFYIWSWWLFLAKRWWWWWWWWWRYVTFDAKGVFQSQKNPVSASAMLTRKFLRIRKVFATCSLFDEEFPDNLENVWMLHKISR